jgi:hypothetical protein
MEHANMSELIDTGMEIIDATLDIERKDEEEMVVVLKDLDNVQIEGGISQEDIMSITT